MRHELFDSRINSNIKNGIKRKHSGHIRIKENDGNRSVHQGPEKVGKLYG